MVITPPRDILNSMFCRQILRFVPVASAGLLCCGLLASTTFGQARSAADGAPAAILEALASGFTAATNDFAAGVKSSIPGVARHKHTACRYQFSPASCAAYDRCYRQQKNLTTFVERSIGDVSHPPSPLIPIIFAELDRTAHISRDGHRRSLARTIGWPWPN